MLDAKKIAKTVELFLLIQNSFPDIVEPHLSELTETRNNPDWRNGDSGKIE